MNFIQLFFESIAVSEGVRLNPTNLPWIRPCAGVYFTENSRAAWQRYEKSLNALFVTRVSRTDPR